MSFDLKALAAGGASSQIEKILCERSLLTFLERAWPHFDPSRYVSNWHLGAIAEHLTAVNSGQIRRLSINVPPRMAKTNLVSIAWPVWTWLQEARAEEYPLFGPQVRFLCVAYGSDKAQEDAVTSRRLFKSQWFMKHWGEVVSIAEDRDAQERYDNSRGGGRISVGIGASVLGRGGDIKIIDDPSKPDEVESDAGRLKVLRAYDETLSSRENDPTTAAEVIIAQRLHEMDLPGHVLSKFGSDPSNGGFVHLNLPLEYDPARHCVTVIGWQDPRGCDSAGNLLPDAEREARKGLSLFPKRFPPDVIAQRKKSEGEYSYSAKYQQAPVPRGGGIIQPDWWQIWPPEGEEFWPDGTPKQDLTYPPMDYIVAYLDTAITEDKKNDPSGMCVYGIWGRDEYTAVGQDEMGCRDEAQVELFGSAPKVMLLNSWYKWLNYPDLVREALKTCRMFHVNCLIIEAKTLGQTVASTFARLFSGEQFSVRLDTRIKGSKDGRLRAVSNFFEQGQIYAPNRPWAKAVMDQCSAGSRGVHDELADCTSGALLFLRRSGEILTQSEHTEEVNSEFALDNSEQLYDV